MWALCSREGRNCRRGNSHCKCPEQAPRPSEALLLPVWHKASNSESRPGHHGQSLHSPLSSWGKGCVAAEFPAAPAGSCSCTTHHPKRVFKGLHYVLGFFLCHRQWSLPVFLSARFLRGQTKAITSNHDYVVPSGHLPGTTTGRINFLN